MRIPRSLSDMFSRKHLDDDFRESYRKVLFGQYKSLNNPVDNPAARAEAESVVRLMEEKPEGESDKKLEWEDLYRLELAIIKLEPGNLLRRRAWILRNEYKEMASADEFKDYMASAPPVAGDNQDEELLRADLVRLQEELNWRYIVIWMLEAYRSEILKKLVRGTLVVILLAIGFMYWSSSVALVASWTDVNLPFLTAVVVPGIVGGLLSTLRRIQDLRFGNNADSDLSQLEQGNTGIYLSPFLGGIFAFILFLLFAAGFAAGDLFPKVEMDSLLVSGLEKMELKEVAKLIVWSFLAGFAEKLVPDRLERLAKSSDGKPAQTPTGT
jgi:hypothetical protein